MGAESVTLGNVLDGGELGFIDYFNCLVPGTGGFRGSCQWYRGDVGEMGRGGIPGDIVPFCDEGFGSVHESAENLLRVWEFEPIVCGGGVGFLPPFAFALTFALASSLCSYADWERGYSQWWRALSVYLWRGCEGDFDRVGFGTECVESWWSEVSPFGALAGVGMVPSVTA